MSGASECGACGNTEPQPPAPVEGWSITAQGDVNLNCGDFANKEELQITLASCCTEFKVPEVNETTCCSALEGTLRNGKPWPLMNQPGKACPNPAMSCREIYLSGSYVSGLYWIRTDHHSTVPTQVWCEMEFNGGGWLRVFNMMAKPGITASAAEMYSIITSNGPVQAVLSNTTSTAIFTQGLNLGAYHEVCCRLFSSSGETRVDHRENSLL
ncbi:uncharacterized protein LOC118413650 [Branchiostoma floridae]|uniref:Uncharacterized protein LOC118413650 n=1 Tax=Branchiostoma floridae TaxID=7739 RepID=A0A9J7MMY0_BRAFL|nr:uncharacterized protein LOC118413650 [Branchiostoma floridae]